MSAGQISQWKRERVLMVDPDHTGLSVSEECRILGVNRSTYYYERQARRNEADLEDLKLILAGCWVRKRSMATERSLETSERSIRTSPGSEYAE